jgi:hypothetical protein
MALARSPTDRAASEQEAFYAECLEQLGSTAVPFLVAGTHAVNLHTGLDRVPKDLDVFCKADDCRRILDHFQRGGYRTEITDERWLAKIRRGPYYTDVIFNSMSGIAPVTNRWFDDHRTARLYGAEVRVVPPTELIWSKLSVQDRERYDGADVAHVILRRSDQIDWQRLLAYAGEFWEVLLGHVVNFRFVYPSERGRIPRWLVDELLGRLRQQEESPPTCPKVCRGGHFSRADYLVDVTRWGFADVLGATDEAE